MAIVKCPKCKDPNFDDGACGCGWCTKCFWRQTCTQGGAYMPDFGKPFKMEPPEWWSNRPTATGVAYGPVIRLDSMYPIKDEFPIRIDDVSC